jgi:hypothetical protein
MSRDHHAFPFNWSMSLGRSPQAHSKRHSGNRILKKLLVFLAKCKYPVMSALVERTSASGKCLHHHADAGHSRKSSVVAGLPNGFLCTHSRVPASSPDTACTVQARVSALSSACGPHRAQRSPRVNRGLHARRWPFSRRACHPTRPARPASPRKTVAMPLDDSADSTGSRLGWPLPW